MPDVTSVRAELYKLNVYRPGDFFKTHNDTPRGDGMFCSLVVCLPQEHTGGNLVVKHGKSEHAFEFAAKSAEKLQWAAFYSDCEHEIKPVESGCRVTLTYNLYVENKHTLCLPGLSCENLKLYKVLEKCLAADDFLPRGGKLAWNTQHCYPHTITAFTDDIEGMLKGSDALAFKVLQKFGLDVEIQALHHDCRGRKSHHKERHYGLFWGNRSSKHRRHHDDEDDDNDHDEEDDEEEKQDSEAEEACLTSLCGLETDEVYSDDDEGCQNEHTRVIWINSDDARKLEQSAVARYGNDISIDVQYSSAVIVAKVPPISKGQSVAAVDSE